MRLPSFLRLSQNGYVSKDRGTTLHLPGNPAFCAGRDALSWVAVFSAAESNFNLLCLSCSKCRRLFLVDRAFLNHCGLHRTPAGAIPLAS